MKKVIILAVILCLSVVVYAGDKGLLFVQKGKVVHIILAKPSEVVLIPAFASGEAIIGRKPIACEKVTDCTVSKPGFYMLKVTGTSFSLMFEGKK